MFIPLHVAALRKALAGVSPDARVLIACNDGVDLLQPTEVNFAEGSRDVDGNPLFILTRGPVGHYPPPAP